jgi:predicted ATPase
MIEKISLKNFKVSRDLTLNLASLTVLAGLNGAGKSTSLQAIALLRQSYEQTAKANNLKLNGSLIRLGHFEDVLSENAEDNSIEISVIIDNKDYHWSNNQTAEFIAPDSLPSFLTTPYFQFLQADRITPHTLYPQTIQQPDFLGVRGEYTADYLARYGETNVSLQRRADTINIISPELMQKIAPTPKLIDQVAAWLQFLSPGVRLSSKRVQGTDEVLLQFNYTSHVLDLDQNRRPTNVGFGLTYSLPIIVACLAAPKGSLLLLENPEAHLHPRGQAALGELLARCAADGVQIIVETHSDHLLNGIRLAVKQQLIQPQDVALHFFSRSVEKGESQVESPQILSNGRLSDWPEGFFDQWDKSLDALLDD